MCVCVCVCVCGESTGESTGVKALKGQNLIKLTCFVTVCVQSGDYAL